MKKYSKKEIIIISSFVFLVLVSIIGITYAWFSAQVEGNDTASTMVVEIADLKLAYTDTNVIKGENILPGWTRDKTFTVENLAEVAVNYDIEIIDVASTFEGQDLVYEIYMGGEKIKDETVLSNTDDTLLANVEIQSQVVQSYIIRIKFKETGSDQNIDQGKSFTGKIQIKALKQSAGSLVWYENCESSPNKMACKILSDNEELTDADIDFSKVASQSETGLYYTADTTVGVYGEDGERIYYYRGNPINNWVSFAEYKWRIVRTTSEGGLKLSYSGDGTSTSIIDDIFADYLEEAPEDPFEEKYLSGYTSNLNSYTGAIQNDSIVKTTIDDWYTGSASNYMSTNYGNYLSDTAIYCADRSSETLEGSELYYPGYYRIVEDYRPTFACPSANASRYTVDSTTGNGYLTNPIALLTADELLYSGLKYLNLINYWTMTPVGYTDSNGISVFGDLGARLEVSSIDSFYNINPIVALKSCVIFNGTGVGTQASPYQITDENCS